MPLASAAPPLPSKELAKHSRGNVPGESCDTRGTSPLLLQHDEKASEVREVSNSREYRRRLFFTTISCVIYAECRLEYLG